jgi:hypothetical protein
MKRIYYISIILVSFVLGSCTNLDENPIGLLAPESFFQKQEDAEAAIMGAYGIMTSRHDYGIEYFYLVGLASDLAQSGSGTGALGQANNFTMTPTHTYVRYVWEYIYKNISACNNVINGVPNINASEEVKNQLIAEAMAIRAHCYFRLVRGWGDVPYIGEFVTDPGLVSEIKRTPVVEIYPKIIADLEFTKQHLPDRNKGDIRSRVTKGTAYTILAEVYLTLGDWEKAAANAEYVIEHENDFGYRLTSDFKDLFDADIPDQDEFIWVVDFLSHYGDYPENYDMFSNVCGVAGSDLGGWSTLTTTEEALNSFDNLDYRKKITFCTAAKFGGITKSYKQFQVPLPHIYKYFIAYGIEGVGGYTTDANIIVYRYAEVLLMAAEALNELNDGPTTKAYEYINRVRARARMQTDYPADLQGLSQQEFRDAVIEERRVELAHEHKRWFDIKRHNLFKEAFTGPQATEVHENWNEWFPIPQNEIDNNPSLTQNPGY